MIITGMTLAHLVGFVLGAFALGIWAAREYYAPKVRWLKYKVKRHEDDAQTWWDQLQRTHDVRFVTHENPRGGLHVQLVATPKQMPYRGALQ